MHCCLRLWSDDEATVKLQALEAGLWKEKSRKTFDRAWLPFSFLAMIFALARFVYQVPGLAFDFVVLHVGPVCSPW